jgi:hypothetical protein
MATRAIGRHIKPLFAMAIGAIEPKMDIIELQIGDRMLKIIPVPAAMTWFAGCVEFRDHFTRWMACSAWKIGMITVETPTGGSMGERWTFVIAMTFFAFVVCVTTGANGEDLFLSFSQAGGFINFKTKDAVFFLMAIHAFQSEKIDMLLMIKGNYGTRFIRRIIYFLGWHRYNRMRYPHDIGWVFACALKRVAVGRIIADYAFCVMAPFTMAAKALPMISPF